MSNKKVLILTDVVSYWRDWYKYNGDEDTDYTVVKPLGLLCAAKYDHVLMMDLDLTRYPSEQICEWLSGELCHQVART